MELPKWVTRLDDAAALVFEADDALDRAIGTDAESEALAAYRNAKKTFRAFEAEFVGRTYLDSCGRCGGAGGWEGWPGYTCYDCAGSGTMPRSYRKVRFPADPRTRAKRAAAHREKVAEENAIFEANVAGLGVVGAAIAEAERMVEAGEAETSETYFRAGLAHKLRRFGSLTEKQIAAVQTGLDREAKRAEQEKASAEAGPLASGRYEIVGEVVSVKTGRNDYGFFNKILVVLDDGRKVYGSNVIVETDARHPDDSPIERYLAREDRVRFTATVEPSNDDPKFGFFKRPAKAEILA